MDESEPLSVSPCINGRFRTACSKVVTLKPSNGQRIIQLMHRAAQKSYLRACQLFCLPLDSLMCEQVTCCPDPSSEEEKNTQVAIQSPPSTIMIVNISNSTLIDCVIGNGAYLSVAERQPLMQNSGLHTHGELSFSSKQEAAQAASPPPPPPPPLPSAEHLSSISIQSSHLTFVIIGDNNSMQAEQSQPMD